MKKNKKIFAHLTLPLLPRNRSASHVGMIVSFVVFITFIIFLYSIVRPVINIGQDKKTMADYLIVKIIENVSSNFTSTSVEIDSEENPSEVCVRLGIFFVLTEIPIKIYGTIVQNESKAVTDAFTNVIGDLGINRTSNENLFFRVYSSPEFPLLEERGTPVSCVNMSDEEYSVGVIKKDVLPFESGLDSLISYYRINYEQLKTGLNVPPGTEFGFDFVQSNGTKIEVGETPSTTDVYVSEVPMQYVNRNADIQSGFINIKVW